VQRALGSVRALRCLEFGLPLVLSIPAGCFSTVQSSGCLFSRALFDWTDPNGHSLSPIVHVLIRDHSDHTRLLSYSLSGGRSSASQLGKGACWVWVRARRKWFVPVTVKRRREDDHKSRFHIPTFDKRAAGARTTPARGDRRNLFLGSSPPRRDHDDEITTIRHNLSVPRFSATGRHPFVLSILELSCSS
jgi:hypothetical protein